MTFVEVLVAIVLLGTGVIVVLGAVQATTLATDTERDHARALEWLQSASEVLVNDAAWRDCTVSASDARANYESHVRGIIDIVPPHWTASQLTLPNPVRYGALDGSYTPTCVTAIERQLVRLQVADTEGEIVETLDVIVVP